MPDRQPAAGFVSLVGAGPGDVGLITVRGLELLKAADLVLYDGLANPELLRHATGRCERTARVVADGERRIDQDEVNHRLIDAARRGLTVCRLKGGDPYIFGRGSEEAAALKAAGVRFEVVPGVTASTAAGAYAGFSLTHREHASAVALITGHERPGKLESMIDYPALAAFPGTLVFYMGLHRLPSIAGDLISAGVPPDAPAAVVSRASLSTQRAVHGRLDELHELAVQAGLEPPSLIVVGECTRLHDTIDWVSERPLSGVSVGVCRPGPQCEDASTKVRALGGEPVPMPTIRIEPPEDWGEVESVLGRLSEFDWVTFTSSNGVRAVCGRLRESGRDVRAFGGAKIAAVGPATAAALEPFGLRADLIAEEHSSGGLAEALGDVQGQSILWPKADRGRETLPGRLSDAGAAVEEVVVYRNVDVEAWPEDVTERLRSGRVDWIALSSGSIARGVARLLPDGAKVKTAAISPNVADVATQSGLNVDAVAAVQDWDGLLSAIADAVND